MLIEDYFYIDLKNIVKNSKRDNISKWKALDREKTLLQLFAPYGDVYIEIKYTQNKFGNRAWLVCPKCLRRFTRLYSVYEKLQCRKCHNLKYSSCNRHREKHFENFVKPYRRFTNLKEKLIRKMRKVKRETLTKEYKQLFDLLMSYQDTQIAFFKYSKSIRDLELKSRKILQKNY